MTTTTLTPKAAATQYIAADFKLCGITRGSKGPRYREWEKHPLTLDQIGGQGLGLLHALSGTCAIDVDDLQESCQWLDTNGIDLDGLLSAEDAVQIKSGRPNRAKLLYRLPPGVTPLRTRRLKTSAGATMIEFRCASSGGASVQDVLPPTIHPDTGKPYEWAGAGDFTNLPELPPALLALWQGIGGNAVPPQIPRVNVTVTATTDNANVEGEDARECPPLELPIVVKLEAAKSDVARVVNVDRESIGEGSRNATLASLAGTMRHRGMGEPAILAALLAENASRCVPPLDDDEVRAIAASIAGYAPSNEGESSTGETPDQVITRLAQLSVIQYDQVRTEEAKNLRVRTTTLDKMVSKARGDSNSQIDAPFTEVDAWPTPVNASELLTEIVETIKRHIVCNAETATAAALWVVMTYLVDQFDVTPLAVITAPEPRCGKSEFRRLLGKMVFRGMHADGMSAAVLFRSFDLWSPTLMIDEYDTFIADNEDLRGIINSGHQRGGSIWRCVGDDHIPTQFKVFGPKLLAGIGKLPATIADRSIQLELRRKLPTETVMRQRDVDPAFFEAIKQKLMRFAEDYSDAVGSARPVMPPDLNDRQQDNFESLFQIAAVAGGQWPELATNAALKLSNAKEDARSRRIELLADIKDIFEIFPDPRVHISSAELIKFLCADEEMSWATYNRGQPITPRQLARLLKEFGIVTGSVRIGAATAKGYQKLHFLDVFARYL